LKTISEKMHRMRAQLVKFRAAQINGLRGLLTEYGEVVPQGRAGIRRECRDKPTPARGSNTPSQSG
jgi:transposase